MPDYQNQDKMSKEFGDGSVLRKLVRIFRTANVVRHHFQGDITPGAGLAQGTAKAFFKNSFNYSNVIPGYTGHDRFARLGDYAEMEAYPILNNALNIYADETTQKNENGQIIEVVSEDKKIQKLLEELFLDVLHLNGKGIWKLVRNLCKYGDAMFLIDITENNGVVNLIQMPANEVEREEGFDKDNMAAIRFRWTTKQNIEIPNAFVAHFRLDGNDMFIPYGQSVLEGARRPWRQLVLLEDAMMVYRITRAAERRVFFLDVGSAPPEDIEAGVEKFKQILKKNKIVNDKGQIDLRYGASMSAEEDYVIPTRGGDSATRIETLPGAQNLGDIEDVEFIKQNLFAAIGIPKAFLTFDQDTGPKSTLSMEDIRFSRTISRIQEAIINELIKIAMIHLFVKGYRGLNLTNFRIKMTNPSTVAELQKNELWRARMELVQSAGEGVFDTSFIYKNFLHLSDDTIEAVRRGQIQDKIFQSKLIALENANGMAAPDMGMGGMGLGGGLGVPPAGGFGGVPMDVGSMQSAPPTAVPGMGEAVRPKFGKDLSRDSSGDFRTATARGVDDIGFSEEEDFVDDDPAGMKQLRRDFTNPLGEAILKEYDKLLEFYSKSEQQKRSSLPEGINEQVLLELIGDVGSQKSTKTMLNEITDISTESEMNLIETKSNATINEVYKKK